MSYSPADSDKASAHIMEMIRPTVPAIDKFTPAARVKTANTLEPSPASTHGDSATDSSNPTTPQDARVRDLTKSMCGLMVDKIDTSPVPKVVRGSTCLMLDDGGPHESDGDFSHSRILKDETANRSATPNLNPDSTHLDAMRGTPTWSGPSNNSFVRSSGTKDDPFVVDSPTAQLSSNAPIAATYHVREDRVGDLPTPGTAQAHFDPDACVFVANLLQTATDQQLEQAVTATFSQFGKVYVKIRRDGRGMPFAFAQYETEDEAQHAVTEGRNIPIMGRHCRTEIARVNRTLYLSRIAGGNVTHEEAREVLQGYGAIEELHYASSAERALYGLPHGIFVRFHFYDDCRDAQIKFRIHDGYRLEQARVPEDLRITPRRQGPATGAGFTNTTPPRYSPRSPAGVRLRFDDRSIFVGNLPCSVNEQRVREHFGHFGVIFNVVLCLKQTSMDPTNLTVFCFVEYSTRGEADTAVQHASRWFDGFQLRVELKVSRRLLMSQAGSPMSNNQMNTSQFPAQAQDMLMVLYQRGVEMGLSQATQAQSINPQMMLPPVYTTYPQSYYHPYDNSLGVFSAPNGTPPTYGLSLTSYGNTNVASNTSQAQFPQGAASTQYGHYEQVDEYAKSTTPLHGETAYVWPIQMSDTGLPSS